MVKTSSKRARAPKSTRRPVRKPPIPPVGALGTEAARLLKDALVTARSVGTEVGGALLSTARGTVRVAGDIAAGVAAEAIRFADRISTAADRVASNLGYPVPGPSGPRSSLLPENILNSIGARKPPQKVELSGKAKADPSRRRRSKTA